MKDLLSKVKSARHGKLEIFEATEPDIRASIDLLHEIEELSSFIDIPNLAGEIRSDHPPFHSPRWGLTAECLWNGPSLYNAGLEQLSQRLAPLEPLHLEQRDASLATSGAVNDLLVRYNDNVRSHPCSMCLLLLLHPLKLLPLPLLGSGNLRAFPLLGPGADETRDSGQSEVQ